MGVRRWTRESCPGGVNSGWPGSRSSQKEVFAWGGGEFLAVGVREVR